jgi:hypothetical protein
MLSSAAEILSSSSKQKCEKTCNVETEGWIFLEASVIIGTQQ